ncbi:4'-phosphopantetheinyl transferase family protein [Nonomuraea diastatica]|uniref:4'-phosphopantetheinyl transferase superfamily protein n=1 Tax=Nonomuraea diastatica TaxID=1848329 RepID=A0A4R4WRI7_9ACTN|nr:4'-phosphopantetheinyl transferase superfamily protein [Nonomuraea diastatica]TDD20275.1 4'-phosphopantetheinyl transferase superfamily protein [Nonomuraea diastatica]
MTLRRDLEIWRIPTARPADLDGLTSWLDEHEQARASCFTDVAARRRFIVSHAGVRHVLGRRLGVRPRDVRIAVGRYGKPYLPTMPDVRWNLSHSGDLALLAVAHGRSVGVDVERLRPELDRAAFARRFFPVEDAGFVDGSPERFASLWARREACVKAAGGRLAQGLRLPVNGPSPVLVRDPAGILPGTWLVLDIPVPCGFRAAVAISVWPARSVTSCRAGDAAVADR